MNDLQNDPLRKLNLKKPLDLKNKMQTLSSTPENKINLKANQNLNSKLKKQSAIQAAQDACSRIAPLWPLQNFVAVNPFVGLSDLSFSETCQLIERVGHGSMTLDPKFYQTAYDQGEITAEDLRQSILSHHLSWDLETALDRLNLSKSNIHRQFCVADALDHHSGSNWLSLIVDEISKWMGAFYDKNQTLWTLPWRDKGLYTAWKLGAEMDRSMEVSGVRGFRSTVRALPENAIDAILIMSDLMEIPQSHRADYYHRLLMTIRGWAGYVQYLVREKSMSGLEDSSLVETLAIRLAYDFALVKSLGPQPEILKTPGREHGENSLIQTLVVWQDAYENANRRQLIQRIQEASQLSVEHSLSKTPKERPSFQAVFCIDVRSEVFRRALEDTAPEAETIGFAGFFGFPVAIQPLARENIQSRCPVLLKPAYQIQECQCDSSSAELTDVASISVEKMAEQYMFQRIWKFFKTASVSCFSFVESLGLTYSLNLTSDSLAWREKSSAPQRSYPLSNQSEDNLQTETGIPSGDQIQLARGALKNMGLTQNFGRLVLICGHGSKTRNNPFGSSLDCGACGGHAGDANARIAVQVLNQAHVRKALQSEGIEIPEDTFFVAGLHETTTDNVQLFDTDNIPDTHQQDLEHLKLALENAGATARLERSTSVGLDNQQSAAQLKALFEKRTRDWAQVRPEWGLAGNYAFIAAPRARTRHLKLDGRSFLHNYDPAKDPDFSTLELILTAPMVVANWINLQYYGSTVNNELFGSGDKTLHNVVGKIGVLEGNGGDLRPGLPIQSVHNGIERVHSPLRLNVLVEAPTEAIDNILAKHENVRKLVENQWLFLFSLQEEGLKVQRRLPDASWSMAF